MVQFVQFKEAPDHDTFYYAGLIYELQSIC